jgi:hypothetical protein
MANEKTPTLWIWDGNLTTGKSGVERNVEDDKDSTSKAFTEEKGIITWPLPVDRYFEDVDPEADADNPSDRRHVSPYAAVVLPRNWTFRGQPMPKGIYLVKLGAYNAGSFKIHQTWQPLPPTAPATLKHLPQRLKAQRATPDPRSLTLVLIQQGRVKAVLPVNQVQPLTRQERKLPRDKGWVHYASQGHAAQPDTARLTIRGKRFKYVADMI